MENKITVFENEKFGTVRTVIIDGEPWFVASDVCKALELSNPTIATGRLDEDERSKFNLGRQGEATIVNEYGLYSLVLGSRKSEAKVFKRWITHEVIPSINKYGMYATEELIANPDLAIAAFTALKEEREKNALLAKTNQALVKETNTWDNRKLLNALIRSYAAACCGDSFAMAWTNFYKTLLYKKGICVSSRVSKTGIKIDTLSKEELADAVQVAVVMCIDNNVQIDMILSHMPDNN